MITTNHSDKKPLLPPVLIMFMVAMILANLGGNMYGPLLSLYLESLGATVTQIGLFYTLSQIVPLVLQILGGWVSDSLGRLRAVAIGSVFGTIGALILVGSTSWLMVLLSSAVGAAAGALVGPSFDAFIAEKSSDDNRARVFGVAQMLYGVVAVIGPPAGGWIVQNYGFKAMLWAAAVLYMMAMVIRIGMARSGKHDTVVYNRAALTFTGLKKNLGELFALVFAGGVITWILITDGVRDVSYGISLNFLGLYMEKIGNLTIQTIGLLNGVFGLFSMALMIPGGWLADKRGERVGISIGFVFNSLALGGIAILPAASPAWMYFVGFALAGIGMGLMAPAYQSLISKAVPAHMRGTAFGLFSTSLGLISLPAPFIGSLLWENISPQFPFLVTAVVSLIIILPVWFKFKLPAASESAAEAPERD
ncbi:MAG: MFS transporter [Anaerolineaceae bacterium]|nr:MFS transporter [Anaerolineaceae bacterium]